MKPNSGATKAWCGLGGGGLGVLPQKIVENGNWETCSRGPCETQQKLYLPAVGGPFFHNLPSQSHQVPKCKKVWRVFNYQIDHFWQKIFTPEKSIKKSIKSSFSLKKSRMLLKKYKVAALHLPQHKWAIKFHLPSSDIHFEIHSVGSTVCTCTQATALVILS